jgi:hypothetical protein
VLKGQAKKEMRQDGMERREKRTKWEKDNAMK